MSDRGNFCKLSTFQMWRKLWETTTFILEDLWKIRKKCSRWQNKPQVYLIVDNRSIFSSSFLKFFYFSFFLESQHFSVFLLEFMTFTCLIRSPKMYEKLIKWADKLPFFSFCLLNLLERMPERKRKRRKTLKSLSDGGIHCSLLDTPIELWIKTRNSKLFFILKWKQF